MMFLRVIAGLLLIGPLDGCGDDAKQPYGALPVRIAVTASLAHDERLVCIEDAVRIGFPTDNGWISILVYGKRHFECSIVPVPPMTWTKTKVTQNYAAEDK